MEGESEQVASEANVVSEHLEILDVRNHEQSQFTAAQDRKYTKSMKRVVYKTTLLLYS
jgi:hypothetical protein